MDMTSLMLSLLFGSVGMGFLMYGKKAGLLVPIGAGLGLMICPYFISSAIVMVIVCGALIVITAILVAVGYIMLQKGSQPLPEQAVEEARLTAEALQNGD